MKTTGIFTCSRFEIPFKKYGEPIELHPFGDVHRTSPLCHEEKWQEWIDYAKRRKNAYFLGMGDLLDMSSTSERDILNNRHLHDSTRETLEDLYRQQVDDFAKEIGFMKGKLIGLIEGNHYAELPSGLTTTQLLCEKLGCRYLGVSTFIRLLLKYSGGKTHVLDVWAHHGLGAGRTVGSSINKVENMIIGAEADIYLMAHDHKKHIAMKSRLRLTDSHKALNLENRKILLARTGGFLKGYENDKASYIADRAYSPVDIGTITITMTPRRSYPGTNDREDMRWVDINGTL